MIGYGPVGLAGWVPFLPRHAHFGRRRLDAHPVPRLAPACLLEPGSRTSFSALILVPSGQETDLDIKARTNR